MYVPRVLYTPTPCCTPCVPLLALVIPHCLPSHLRSSRCVREASARRIWCRSHLENGANLTSSRRLVFQPNLPPSSLLLPPFCCIIIPRLLRLYSSPSHRGLSPFQHAILIHSGAPSSSEIRKEKIIYTYISQSHKGGRTIRKISLRDVLISCSRFLRGFFFRFNIKIVFLFVDCEFSTIDRDVSVHDKSLGLYWDSFLFSSIVTI